MADCSDGRNPVLTSTNRAQVGWLCSTGGLARRRWVCRVSFLFFFFFIVLSSSYLVIQLDRILIWLITDYEVA